MIALPWMALGAVLAIGFAGTAGYLKGHELGETQGKAEIQTLWDAEKVRMQSALNEANENAHVLGQLYEEERAKRAVRARAINKGVSRAIESDTVWSAAAVPDGVRGALDTAAADLIVDAAPKPDFAVPAASTPRAPEERGLGAWFRDRLGRLGGVPGQAQSVD